MPMPRRSPHEFSCSPLCGRRSHYASELGYHVTLVRDATAAFSPEAMHSAHEIDGPTFAHAIVTTAELIATLVPSEAAPA